MASTAALELIVKLDDRASKGMDTIAQKGGGLGKVMKGMLGPATLLTGGIGLLGAGLFAAGQAAADEEVGMKRLQQTLKNSVAGYNAADGAVEKYISQQEKLAFADDELRDSLAHLVGQTGDLTEAQELQATAMDLARAKGISLEAATKAVGKVDQESIGILKKLGIQVTENMTKEEALTAIRAASAGQAQEYANSAAGSMELVQNAFGNAIEDIGGVVLPGITAAMGAISSVLSSEGFQSGIKAAADVVGTVLVGAWNLLSGVIATVWPFIQGVWNFFTSEPVASAIGEIAKVLGDTLTAAWEFVEDAAKAAWNGVLKPIWDWFTSTDVQKTIGEIAKALGEGLKKAWDFLSDAAKFAWNSVLKPIWDWFTSTTVQRVIGEIAQALGEALKNAFNFLKDAAQFAWNNVLKPIWDYFSQTDVQNTIGEIARVLGDVLKSAFNFLRDAAQAAWNNVLKPIWDFFTSEGVSTAAGNIASALGTVLKTAWDVLSGAAKLAWDNVLKPIWDFFTSDLVSGVIGTIANALGFILGGAWNVLKFAAETAWGILSGIWKFFTGDNPVVAAVKTIADAFGNILGGAFDAVFDAAKAAWDFLVGIWEFFAGSNGVPQDIGKVTNAVRDLTGAFDALGRMASSVLNSTASALATIIRNVENAKAIGGGGGGGGGGSPAPVDDSGGHGRALGGPVRKGMAYIVGERRPELFVPDVNGSIIPNLNMLRRTPSFAGTTSGGGGGGGVNWSGNINIYASPGMDVRQLSAQVVRTLSEELGLNDRLVHPSG